MKKIRNLLSLSLALMLMMTIPASAEEVTYDVSSETTAIEDHTIVAEKDLTEECEVFSYGLAGEDSTSEAQYMIAENGCITVFFPVHSADNSTVEYALEDYPQEVISAEAGVTYTIEDGSSNHAVAYRIDEDGEVTVYLPAVSEDGITGEVITQDYEEQVIAAETGITYVLEGTDGEADVTYTVKEDGSVIIQFSEKAGSAYYESITDYTIAEEVETIEYDVTVGE